MKTKIYGHSKIYRPEDFEEILIREIICLSEERASYYFPEISEKASGKF
jgi:hypothetical protein